MAELGDILAAFSLPTPAGGCCNCLTSGPPECPSIFIEAKQCYGEFSRPGPCGLLNPDDGQWYLTKTSNWSYSVRAADPEPHFYACEEWFLGGTLPRRVKTEIVDSDVNYTSQQVVNYTVDEEGGCNGPDTSTTEDTYTVTSYVNTVYNISNTECLGGGTGEIPPPGGPLTELDPDSTDPVVVYSNPWEPMSSEEVLGEAQAAHDANCDPEADWIGSPLADRQVSLDGDGEVTYAAVTTAQTRFYIYGGNTGYLHFRWAVVDELGNEVSSGTVTRTWDPMAEFEETIAGPSLDAPAPDYGSGETLRTLQLIITESTCEPPTP
jgi:hypothetical protein